MKKLNGLMKHMLGRVRAASAAGTWIRATRSGDAWSLAGLYRRGLVVRCRNGKTVYGYSYASTDSPLAQEFEAQRAHSTAKTCANDGCDRLIRNRSGDSARDICAKCTTRAERAARRAQPPVAVTTPNRWKNIAVALDRGEVFVDQFAIGSFAFVVSNRSLFFAHAVALSDEQLGKAVPSIHRVSLPEGLV